MTSGSPPASLFEVLRERRNQLITSWSARIQSAVASAPLSRAELLDRIPSFVDEIVRAIYPDAIPLPATSVNAEEHGQQRLRLGFDVSEVVREYGVLHECILDIARDAGVVINPRDQSLIVKWINTGIADAVGEYVRQRELEAQRQASEHLGFIAHELRNPLGAARMAFQRLRQTQLGEGRTVEIVDRNLRRTADMIDSVLSHASLKLGIVPLPSRITLAAFLREIEADAAIEAQARSITTVVVAPDDLTIEADPRLLRSAISNLFHNALKFSHAHETVTLTARDAGGRVTIDVADGCGGLPPGLTDELFSPLVQHGEDRSGFGLGLAIALQAAEAHHGTIRVRDAPGTGCVFTIDLPKTARR